MARVSTGPWFSSTWPFHWSSSRGFPSLAAGFQEGKCRTLYRSWLRNCVVSFCYFLLAKRRHGSSSDLREQRNRLRFLMGAGPTPQCKVACVQGWEEFVAVVFNLLYSLLFLSWARIPEGGMCSSFRSCLFRAVSIPRQALPLRGVACSCPAAVTMAKCNLEKEQRTHSGSGSIPRNQFG